MAATDNLLCHYLFSEAAGVTRDNAEGTAALDAVDTGTIDFPLSAVSDFSDGSLLHTGLQSANALSVAEANLAADFPGKSGGTGEDYTVYSRIRTQSSVSAIARRIIIITNSWQILQQPGNDDRDILCAHTDDSSTQHTITLTVPDHDNFSSVAQRYKSGVFSAWLNGAKDSELTITGPKEVANALFIGNDGNANSRSPDVYIDEIVIYARALTDTEMLSLHLKGMVT